MCREIIRCIPRRIICFLIAIFFQFDEVSASHQLQQRNRKLDLYDLCWKLQADVYYYDYTDPRCENFEYELLPERPPAHCEHLLNPKKDIDINDPYYDGPFYQACKDWLNLYSNNKVSPTSETSSIIVDNQTASNPPSVQSSSFPSFGPTLEPSTVPSHSPTTGPSLLPTSLPSSKPSSRASSTPSENFSMQPSSKPSSMLTEPPSSIPTFSPTEAPKITIPLLTFSMTLGVNKNQEISNDELFQLLYVFLSKYFSDSFEEPYKFSTIILEMRPLRRNPTDPLIFETQFWGEVLFYEAFSAPSNDRINQVVLNSFQGDSVREFIRGLYQSDVTYVHVNTYFNQQKDKGNKETSDPSAMSSKTNSNISLAAVGVALSGIGLISILAIYTFRMRKNDMLGSNDQPPPMGDLFHRQSKEIEIQQNNNVVEEVREIESFQSLDEDITEDTRPGFRSLFGSKSSLFSLSERSSFRSLYSSNGRQDSLCFSDSSAFVSEASTCISEINGVAAVEPDFFDCPPDLT